MPISLVVPYSPVPVLSPTHADSSSFNELAAKTEALKSANNIAKTMSGRFLKTAQ
jgi:hypothetical protein